MRALWTSLLLALASWAHAESQVESSLRFQQVSPGQLIELNVSVYTEHGLPALPGFKKVSGTQLLPVRFEGEEPYWQQGRWRQNFQFEFMAMETGDFVIEPIRFRFENSEYALVETKPHKVEVFSHFEGSEASPQALQAIPWSTPKQSNYWLPTAFLLCLICLAGLLRVRIKESSAPEWDSFQLANNKLEQVELTEHGWQQLQVWCCQFLGQDPLQARAGDAHWIDTFQTQFFNPRRSDEQLQQLIRQCQQELSCRRQP